MSSTLDKLLKQQEDKDQILANTGNLKRLLRAARVAKTHAGQSGNIELGELPGSQYFSPVESTYKPFVSVLSQYLRKSTQALNIAEGGPTDCLFESGNANFIGDMMIMIKFPQIAASSLVPIPGLPFAPVPGYGRVRYCSYPGVRLLRSVSLRLNGKIVETYTPENMMDFAFHELDVDKLPAWERCVGQQQVQSGKYSYALDQFGVPVQPGHQLIGQFTNGPQTPKDVQPPLTLTIPVLFNWARDPAVLMPNDYLNSKVRSLQLNLAPINEIVSHYVDMPVAVVPRDFRLTSVEIYTRAIFMDEDLAMMFMNKEKTLIRCWRTVTVDQNAIGNITYRMDTIKYPIECMYVRFVPKVNSIAATTLGGNNIPTYDYWYIPAVVTKTVLPVSFLGVNPVTSLTYQNSVTYQFFNMTEIVSGLQLLIQDVDIYGGILDPQMLSSYSPFTERSIHSSTPWPGSYIFNFSQNFKGDLTRTVAGYADFTEFTNKLLNYQTSVISETFPCTMVLSCKYLNFYQPQANNIIEYTYAPAN